jgi:HEAT repeat protein
MENNGAFNFDDFESELDDPRTDAATIHEALAAIQLASETDATLPAAVVYRLADLEPEDFALFKEAWQTLPPTKRHWLLSILTDITESDYMMAFDDVARFALKDEAASVRAQAIELLWHDMSESFFETMMQMAADENPLVRAAAVATLGRFIQAGELEEFNHELSRKAETLVADYYRDYKQDLEVRRRALEAISHCSHEAVSDMIREAYYSDDELMQISAVFAMGCTFDEQWKDIVQAELDSEIPELRFEAVRAAGQLEMAEAVPELTEAAFDEDYEIQLMAIWSLGEIGTQEAQRVLNNVVEIAIEKDDDELITAAEEALENAMLMKNAIFPMFNLGGDLDLDEYDDFDNPALLN